MKWRKAVVIGRFNIPFDKASYKPVITIGDDLYDCLGLSMPVRRAASGKFMISYKRRRAVDPHRI